MTSERQSNSAPHSAFEFSAAVARRTDVALRSRYPHLLTTIFQTGEGSYAIFFEKAQLDAKAIADDFNLKIKPMTANIEVTNSRPIDPIATVEALADIHLATALAGISMTGQDARYLLLSKYPDLPDFATGNGSSPIELTFGRVLNQDEEACVRAFFDGVMPGWPVAVKAGAINANPLTFNHRDLNIVPNSLRSTPAAFIREDEDFWFHRVDRLFQNRVQPNTYLDEEDRGHACYLDASTFPQIDLRQLVLLYDTIYLTPPLIDSDFWRDQHLGQQELLHLVEAGRLKLVLVQPEERTGLKFIEAVHERDAQAVIGRRKSSAWLISDIVQTASEYRLNEPSLRPMAGLLVEELHPTLAGLGYSTEDLSRLLLWPQHAKLACLEPLLRSGLLGAAAFDHSTIFASMNERLSGRNVLLEASATFPSVLTAHFLNATLIPPSSEMGGWIAPRQWMAEYLNFYRSFNTRIAPQWAMNERRKEEGRQTLLPPIPLFEFERHASIHDLLQASELGGTRRKGRALVTRLAAMPEEERNSELERLSAEFYRMGLRRSELSMRLDVGEAALDVGAEMAKAAIPPVTAAWKLLRFALATARKNSRLDKWSDAVESTMSERLGINEDLDFLSKINRVARIP